MFVLNLLPLLIVAVGIYFLVKLRFFFIAHPIKVLKKIAVTAKDKSSRKALTLALAGTLGVGNIVGVAYGIKETGAGCIFWILISSLFASVIKYAESTLAADMRGYKGSGMIHVIKGVFGRFGGAFATIYATLCLMLSVTMGTALQAKSAVDFAAHLIDIKPIIFVAFFAVVIFLSVLKGAEKIENITAFVIPFATIVYIFLCFSVIFINTSSITGVVFEIFSSAFSFKSAGCGALIFFTSAAVREGFARGLLSNEAGAGTSAMAEARSKKEEPSAVGLFGMLEVYFDTALLCTLTGVAILASGVNISLFSDSASLILGAFSKSLGPFSETALLILIFAFSYSTVICWYYYGFECVRFIFKTENRKVFLTFFIASVFIGTAVNERILMTLTDYILLFMTVITLTALIKKSERVLVLSENYGLLKNSDI